MSAPGFTSILLYSSATATSIPLPANLAQGELAINTADGKLFYKDNFNNVQVIGWKNVPVSAGGTGTTTSTGTGSVVLNSNPGFNTNITVNGVIFGKGAGSPTSLSSNVAIGVSTLYSNTTGFRNVALGNLTLGLNTTGDDNVALGYQAMYYNTTGDYNVAIGYASMAQSITGSNNVAIGPGTLLYNGDGIENTAVGSYALYTNSGADYNSALGSGALFSSTGSRNTGVGYYAGNAITTGSNNVIVGSYTGNSGGLDIRTSSNNVVLSDGQGNIRQVITSNNKVLFGTAAITGNIGSVFNNSGYALALETLDSGNSTLLGSIKRISKALGGTADPSFGYVLLVPAYNGGATIGKSRFTGTLYTERGSTAAYNISGALQLTVSSAYNENRFGAVSYGTGTWEIVTCTYGGVLYIAARNAVAATSARSITIDGLYTDNFTPVLVADGTVSGVTVLGTYSNADTYTNNITSTGNTILGNASTDTLNVGNGGLVKDAAGNVNIAGLTASQAVATDASKNLVSVATTGAGNYVLATSPTLVTPILGTPQSGTLTNCTFPTLNQNTTGTAAGLSGSQTANTVYAAPNGSAGTATFRAIVAADIPTLNQNTTGSAATWTTSRNLAGNSVNGSANVAFSNKFIVQGTTDTGLSGAQFLGSLGTGIVKNTTSTGVLSIAVAGDFPTLNQNTSGSSGSCTGNAATATTATNIALGAAGQIPYNTGPGATSFIAVGTTGQVLKSNGTSAPTWQNGMTPTSGTAPYFGVRAYFYVDTNAPVASTALTVGRQYVIWVPGTTTWTSVGASSNALGTIFTATGSASGTGTAVAVNSQGFSNWQVTASQYQARFTFAITPPDIRYIVTSTVGENGTQRYVSEIARTGSTFTLQTSDDPSVNNFAQMNVMVIY
jgi:hypothetical protein